MAFEETEGLVGRGEWLKLDPDIGLPPDDENKFNKDEARVFPLLSFEDGGVVRDHVREQLSTVEVAKVNFRLPEADVATNTGPDERGFFSLPPDLSEMSLGGPVADAIDIFSSSNSIGPIDLKKYLIL